MNCLFEVLRDQGAKIDLKINVKKTKFLKLRIYEVEEVMLGNKKFDPRDSIIYLGSIRSKEGGYSEDAKTRLTKARFFSTVGTSLEE